jgi:hypothetical protein
MIIFINSIDSARLLILMEYPMTELDKGCRGFEKLLLSLVRHSKDQTLQTEKWVNIWCKVADYRSYCHIHKIPKL